jgi:AhpC/TSA family
MTIDIIYGEHVATGVDAESKDGELWLSAEDLKRISGWEFKPQGFCKGDVCVPVPDARKSEFVAGGRYNLAALANLLGQPVVTDAEHDAWCFGEAATERKRVLTSLDAPDFSLPDLDGKMHSLSEHRGKKVLLVSWASW